MSINLPSIEHPTDRPNFAIVRLHDGSKLAFSYETLIGFRKHAEWITRENTWGPTTGKHLNWLAEAGDTRRYPSAEFERLYTDTFGRQLPTGEYI